MTLSAIPRSSESLGQKVTPFDDNVWDLNKKRIVREGNRAKFAQNPELKKMLLQTGDAILAEASPKDKNWGIGMTAAKAENTDPSEWPGENLLGNILMELREEFRKG